MGADAYVVKPFDPEYLFALIRSMLKNRDNVRQILEIIQKLKPIMILLFRKEIDHYWIVYIKLWKKICPTLN